MQPTPSCAQRFSTVRWTCALVLAGLGLALATPATAPATAYPGNLSRNLDLPELPSGDSAEINMMPGRLNKLPASWFFQTQLELAAPQSLLVRTSGCLGTADTGLLVTWRDTHRFPYTAFDNDGNAKDGNGKCSALAIAPSHSQMTITYTVYVFSMTRATSSATLEYSLDDGVSWVPVVADHFGGIVVRVGALPTGDFVQVQTPSDGHDPEEAISLLLFQAPDAKSSVVAHATQRGAPLSAADRDPQVVADDTWPSPFNAVLVGKTARQAGSQKGVEVHIDLVRGPVDTDTTDGALTCTQGRCYGAEMVLPPGRYFLSLFAAAEEPLGSVVPGSEHLASEMGTDAYDHCPDFPRGRGNDRAFLAHLLKNGAVVQTRVVPRALLGASPGMDYNRILFAVEADGIARWRLDVGDGATDILFFPHWRAERNPEVNHLKVASWNFAYWAADGDTAARTAILHNAVDLLGTRGDIHPDTFQVVERPDQAPWQWEADVLTFQEFYSSTWPAVADRLHERTAHTWSHINANTEIAESPVGDYVYYGPVFVNDLFTPQEGITYSDTQLDDGVSPDRCHSRWEGSSFDFACPLGMVDNFTVNFYNRAVPAKLTAKRALGQNPGRDRPVALFNWHLYHEEDRANPRRRNVEEMIQHIRYLMAQPADGMHPAGACAFNKECVDDPLHDANRIILIGDSNMRNHFCGEFTWNIQRLRDAFGYAVDVASATLDRDDRTFDLHYSGGLLSGSSPSSWGSCQQTAGPWSKTQHADGTLSGCPFQFQHKANWTADTPLDLSTHSWFPWWAATSQDIDGSNAGGSRWDVIFLVGRGWADDDPIVSYKVLPHHDEPSPMSGGVGGGVEIGYDFTTCVGRVTDGNGNYAPNVSIDGCGTGEGQPALRSDHVPLGAKLRLWNR